MMRLPFGSLEPDVAELDSGVAAVANNVYPDLNAYRPVAGPSAYSAAMVAEPRGLWLVRKESGLYTIIAATASKLYRLNGTAWDEIGSGYSLPADEMWSGVQFGNYLIVTNITDGPQVYDIEAVGTFAALGGSPGTARFVDVIGDHLVLACLGTDAFSIKWCDTNDITNWSTLNAGSQPFPDGGRVQNFSGAAGLVIQETTIRKMVFTPGSSEVFQFYKVEEAKGALSPYSVIKYGPAVAYLAEDGFWFVGPGGGEPIGVNKINRYFLANANQTRLFSVVGDFHPTLPLFIWLYKTTSESAVYDAGLVYNWAVKRWATLSGLSIYVLSHIATPGYTLEQLAVLYPVLEDIPYSLDSRVWQGGRPVLSVFDTDYKLAFFEGSNLEATMETGEAQLTPGRRSKVRWLKPLIDTSAALGRVGVRQRQADSRTWKTEAAMQTSGRVPVFADGMLHRFRVRIPAASTWTSAQGVEIDATATGVR